MYWEMTLGISSIFLIIKTSNSLDLSVTAKIKMKATWYPEIGYDFLINNITRAQKLKYHLTGSHVHTHTYLKTIFLTSPYIKHLKTYSYYHIATPPLFFSLIIQTNTPPLSSLLSPLHLNYKHKHRHLYLLHTHLYYDFVSVY